MVDPGFPIGGDQAIGGHQPLMQVLLAKTYVKMKELDSIGGACWWYPLGSANVHIHIFVSRFLDTIILLMLSIPIWVHVLRYGV